MPKAPTKPQHETQPLPIAEPGAGSGNGQPTDDGEAGNGQQPIEPDPAEIVDAHRTERPVEDLGGEID